MWEKLQETGYFCLVYLKLADMQECHIFGSLSLSILQCDLKRSQKVSFATSVVKYNKILYKNIQCIFLAQKVKISTSRQIELTDLDRGESYCFSVQVYLPSRSINKQHGELSQVQCSSGGNPSILNGKLIQCVSKYLVIIVQCLPAHRVEGIFMTMLHCSTNNSQKVYFTFLKTGIVV